MWHTGTGVIQYDPPRGRMKKKVDWWCVINIDKEITRYYRWWVTRELHVKGLFAPSWDAHISVVRGSNDIRSYDRNLGLTSYPDANQLWKKYDGETVTFQYQHKPELAEKRKHRDGEEGRFWTLEVQCPRGTEIRKELGLKHDWPLHLTFGRTWW